MKLETFESASQIVSEINWNLSRIKDLSADINSIREEESSGITIIALNRRMIFDKKTVIDHLEKEKKELEGKTDNLKQLFEKL